MSEGAGQKYLCLIWTPPVVFFNKLATISFRRGSISPVITFLMMIGRFSYYLCGPTLFVCFRIQIEISTVRHAIIQDLIDVKIFKDHLK